MKTENWLCITIKQWPLAPNLQKWQITCVNVSNASHIFPKMTFGECGRVWRVRAKQVGECGRVWQVRAKQVGKCRQIYRVRAKQVGECRPKQDRSFYAQITYFICIKWSSLHSLNSPNSPNLLNSRKSCQTCLLRVWRVRAKWFGKSWIQQKWQIFGEYSNLTNSLSSGHCLIKILLLIYEISLKSNAFFLPR